MHALIYLMQAIHEAIDSGNCSVRIFFADFTKGFDIIVHPILLDELSSAFLDSLLPLYQPNTSSARRFLPVIMETSQWWRSAGHKTRINALNFAVIVNKLLMNWHMRTKYVDDTNCFRDYPKKLY